jgi:hypothetical protein
MNIEEQDKAFETMVCIMKQTLMKKGNDYANTDRLSNFKQAGAIVGIKPEQVALNLIAIKVARLGVLLNADYQPFNESVKDSVLDLANYAILLDMIIQDTAKKLYENKAL